MTAHNTDSWEIAILGMCLFYCLIFIHKIPYAMEIFIFFHT